MQNKHFLSLVFLGIMTLFAACDPNETFYPEWIGDYSIESIKTFEPDGNYTEQVKEDYPPLSIFKDKGLYVQTFGIGNPFIPGVDSDKHVLVQDHYANYSTTSTIDPSAEYSVIIRNGMINTYSKNLIISPKPIKVLSTSSDSLALENGEPFELPLRDGNGNSIGTAVAYWKYCPIKKENDICTWDAYLYVFDDNGVFLISCRHHLVFRKK